jgi:hypothetical protein
MKLSSRKLVRAVLIIAALLVAMNWYEEICLFLDRFNYIRGPQDPKAVGALAILIIVTLIAIAVRIGWKE